MYKHLLKTLLLGCTLSVLALGNVQAASGTNNAETKINNTIHSYIENEMKSIKDFKAYDSQNLICNNDLEEYSKTKNNYYAQWYKGINYKLKNYDIKISYNNLNIQNDTANVVVNDNLTMVFDKDSDMKQQQALKYKFILKNINGQWKIQDIIDLNEENKTDVYKSSTLKTFMVADNANKVNYKELKAQFSNVQADLNAKNNQDKIDIEQSQKLLDKSQNNIKSLSSYNASGSGAGAAAYAENWAHRRNPNFPDYEDQGGDCTNFVSQCLNYGGIGQTSYWWANSNDSSTYWRCVIPFYNWLINGGVGFESNRYICKPGDVLQFYNANYQEWHHSAIVVAKKDNTVYYDAHSSDVNDQNLDNVYPGRYSNCRVIGIRY